MARKKKRERVSARGRAEKHGTGFTETLFKINSDVKLFSVKSDKALRIDIISYEVKSDTNPFADTGQLHFERTFFTHRGIGSGDNSYICPAKTFGKKCPICDYRKKLADDPSADEDTIKELRPKERQLWNIKDLDSPELGVQLWDISFHLFGKQLDAAIRNADEDDEFEFFADNEDGMSLKVGINERSFNGRAFYEAETIYFKKRKENYGEEILEEAHDLDGILREYSYEELKAIFLQVEDGSDDDNDDDDTPPPAKKRTRKAKPKPAPEPEPEDDEGEWEEEEEEPEPPKKNTRTRKPKPAPEPEPEEEEEWEEEEEEPEDLKPAKKAPAKKRKPKPEPEPEPEEEEEWEEEEEEPEPPKKKRPAKAPAKKKKPAPKPEPEDDGGDEDWEEWE